MPRTAALLPGSASDEVFVTAVFGDVLAGLGVELRAVPPRPGAGVVRRLHRDLDAIADDCDGPLLVGGVSLGAHVATAWAARRPDRVAGLLVALPAWTGDPGTAPAAVAARLTAEAVRRDGVHRVLDGVRASSPRWLADELGRAWLRHGDALADTLDTAAGTRAPTVAELRGIGIPTGIAATADDPVHPRQVADVWASALPAAAAVATSMAALGRDRGVLGRAAVLAWLRARARAAP